MYYIKSRETFTKIDSDGFFTNEFNIALDLLNRPITNCHYESSLIEWCVDQLVQSDKNFVDIGAHIGTWSWVAAKKAKHTYSFECNPHVYNCLCANIGLKGLSHKTTTYNTALSDKNELSTYYFRSDDGGGNGLVRLNENDDKLNKLTVTTKKLDDYDISNIGFMKIDVEGAELNVLKGATKTLMESDYPKFIFECWSEDQVEKNGYPKNLKQDLFEYINSLEYRLQPINGWPHMFLAHR